VRTLRYVLCAILLGATGCGEGSRRSGLGEAETAADAVAQRDAAAAVAETPTPSLEERLKLDSRPFPLLTWSAYLIDVDYYDRARFDLRRQLESTLRALESHAPEISGVLEANSLVMTVEAERRRIEFSPPTTTVEASDVVATALSFAQEVLNLPEEELHKLEYAAIDGLLAPLDPHTVLLPPEAAEDLGVKTRGHFGGIGAEIRSFDRRILIRRVLPGSPAEKAGVEDGDLLVKIDGQSTVNMRTVDAQQLLRGPLGVDVTVRVIRDGAYLNLTITRGKIRLPTTRRVLLPGDIGYVGLMSFQSDTTERMVEAIEALQQESAEREGLRGLLLDLRGNSGGLLSQATAVVDQFVEVGDLVLVHSADGTEVERATRAMAVPQDLPLVVLIDEQSASASEIVSGSLKHLGRAAVVGRTSFGKGTVQMLREATPYGDDLALKMTIAEYRVAGDRKINAVGVRPQITLLPVQLSELAGVVRYYDRERFVRWRQRYQTSFLPSSVHDEGADAFAVPEGPLIRYLDDVGTVEEDTRMSEEVKDYMADAEVRIARALAEALEPHAGKEARRAALETFVPEARDVQRRKIEAGLAQQKVDWSRAPDGALQPPLELRAWIDAKGGIKSGEPFVLNFEVHNKGTTAANRVRLVTDCPLDELDGIEFLFGEVAANSRMKRRIELQVMPWDASLVERLTVELWQDEGPAARTSAGVDLVVQGRPRPRFELDWWVMDDPAMVRKSPKRPKPRFPVDVPFAVAGNGDGVLQPGERVLVAFSATNVGAGKSVDTRAILNNHSGVQGLLEEGNISLGSVRSGGRVSGAFGLSVSPEAVAGKGMELEFFVGDAHLRESTGAEIRLPVAPATTPVHTAAKGKYRVVAESARLYAGAHADAVQVMEVPQDSVLRGEVIHGRWLGVRGPARRRLWVPLDVLEATNDGRLTELKSAALVAPPVVTVEAIATTTDAKNITLRGVATHAVGVGDVTVLVEPTDPALPVRKVLYRSASAPADDAAAPLLSVPARDSKRPAKLVRTAVPFEVSVPLALGSNKIVVQARDAYGVEGVTERWVFRTVTAVGESVVAAPPVAP
jgi:carboxyl-terminal processing protease